MKKKLSNIIYPNYNRWIKEHYNDKFFILAKKKKLRSRAWFKLNEINKTYNFLKKGITVIDLGSSPGSWSKYVSNKIGQTGRIIACDILPMKPIKGVEFIQGDFSNNLFFNMFIKKIGVKSTQVVLSDMSPNISGIPLIDVSKSIFLGKIALNLCCNVLVTGGTFLIKIFQGKNFDKYIKLIRSLFMNIKIRKPESSKARSREVYILAIGKK